VEGARKRLKNVEDLEGNSKCVKFLHQLQVDNVSHKNVASTTRAPVAIMSDSEESDFGDKSVAADIMETEEEIL
jgi:hypothetical protein